MSFKQRCKAIVGALFRSPAPRGGTDAVTRGLVRSHDDRAPADSRPVVEYAPERDGEPDPGEVVWGWVPFEEDASQGKDRPVLLIGRDGSDWLGLMLTSKDHDRDAAQEEHWGRHWMDVGTGGWDRQGRPSEVRLDRLLRLSGDSIRREGAALDRDVFDGVLSAARSFHTF